MSWRLTAAPRGNEHYITDDDGKNIAHVSMAVTSTLDLITTAPELLEACKAVLASVCWDSKTDTASFEIDGNTIKTIKAAISKAQGGK